MCIVTRLDGRAYFICTYELIPCLSKAQDDADDLCHMKPSTGSGSQNLCDAYLKWAFPIPEAQASQA